MHLKMITVLSGSHLPKYLRRSWKQPGLFFCKGCVKLGMDTQWRTQVGLKVFILVVGCNLGGVEGNIKDIFIDPLDGRCGGAGGWGLGWCTGILQTGLPKTDRLTHLYILQITQLPLVYLDTGYILAPCAPDVGRPAAIFTIWYGHALSSKATSHRWSSFYMIKWAPC